jgi:hypothetical protein
MKGMIVPDPFPISIPDRLPIRIEPCPIVEAIFEARFVSPEPWATMPGLPKPELLAKLNPIYE